MHVNIRNYKYKYWDVHYNKNRFFTFSSQITIKEMAETPEQTLNTYDTNQYFHTLESQLWFDNIFVLLVFTHFLSLLKIVICFRWVKIMY